VIQDPPDNGTAVVNADNSIDYVPNENFFGTDTMTYQVTGTVSQGFIQQSYAKASTIKKQITVSISVNPVNDPPTIGLNNITINEDGVRDFNVFDAVTNVDGSSEVMTIESYTQPSNGQLMG